MTRNYYLAALGVLLLASGAARLVAAAETSGDATENASGPPVDLFQAMDDKQVDVKFIAKNDHAARVLITNKTDQPINLQLPEAFAGVPVLAQFGGGGAGRGGGNRGGGGGGGAQQSVGGGLGGGGGGGIGGGGGGGLFSVPPEKTARINVPVVCLNHGARDPSSATPYKIVPAGEHLDRPAVIELLKAFGRGDLEHGAAQAAAWHLNNDLGWDELAAKTQGTRRSLSHPPYFSGEQLKAGMAYAAESHRLAEVNAESYERDKAARENKASQLDSSEARSTTDADANATE